MTQTFEELLASGALDNFEASEKAWLERVWPGVYDNSPANFDLAAEGVRRLYADNDLAEPTIVCLTDEFVAQVFITMDRAYRKNAGSNADARTLVEMWRNDPAQVETIVRDYMFTKYQWARYDWYWEAHFEAFMKTLEVLSRDIHGTQPISIDFVTKMLDRNTDYVNIVNIDEYKSKGQGDWSWIAHVEHEHEHGRAKYYERLEPYKMVAANAGVAFYFEGFAILCDKVQEYRETLIDPLNTENTIEYNEYKSGVRLYTINVPDNAGGRNSVRLPFDKGETIIMEPHMLTKEQFQNEQNAEVRRIMITRLGLAGGNLEELFGASLVNECADPTQIDKPYDWVDMNKKERNDFLDNYGEIHLQLWQFQDDDLGRVQYLRVRNGTPLDPNDHDGEHKWYVIWPRVIDGGYKHAYDAVVGTFPFSLGDYSMMVRT